MSTLWSFFLNLLQSQMVSPLLLLFLFPSSGLKLTPAASCSRDAPVFYLLALQNAAPLERPHSEVPKYTQVASWITSISPSSVWPRPLGSLFVFASIFTVIIKGNTELLDKEGHKLLHWIWTGQCLTDSVKSHFSRLLVENNTESQLLCLLISECMVPLVSCARILFLAVQVIKYCHF